jgi:hypothetical protein
LPASSFSPHEVDSFYEANGIRKESFTLNVVAEEEIEKLLKSLNVHKSTGCDSISARFLKAFDTVDHDILLCKLKSIGLDNNSVNWFQSYLTDRKQYVEINGTASGFADVTCGVLQGSILGPLLFLVYVHDMQTCISKECELLLYADDSVLVTSSKNIEQINNILSSQLKSVQDWLVKNKLSLHLGKTQSIVFGSKQKLNVESRLKVECDGSVVRSECSVKYLGVSIDQDMSGYTMANSVIAKINKGLKMLYRKQEYFGFRDRKMLCSTYLQAFFNYG